MKEEESERGGELDHKLEEDHILQQVKKIKNRIKEDTQQRKDEELKTKRKKTKEETANQPFYRGLFGIKGSKKKISSTLNT